MSSEVAGLDWSDGRMLPAFQTPQHLAMYDIRSASRDVQLTITTMVGLINRPQPRVYLITGDDDLFWLKQALHAISSDSASVSGNDVLETLLITYRSCFQGLVLYDPNLSDTINIATTLAGQQDAIVVSPDQSEDLHTTFELPILSDLRTYKWRTRLQAYHWAQQNLLAGSSSRLVAGLDPNNLTGLRSFLVATRTFVYWLDSRKYVPDLSDGMLSERGLMQQLLNSFSPGTTHIGWFIDESSGVNLTSQVAIGVLASDNFFNLEVWAATRLQSSIPPSQSVAESASSNTVYVSFTMSDGDNLQYSQHRMLQIWRDGVRGSLPIGWTISPSIVQVAPAMADYYMSTATANDELIAGPSGAAYMFPSHWPAEHLASFFQNTGHLMQAMGMTTLEVLDTDFFQSSGLPFVSNIRLTGMAFKDENYQKLFVQGLAHLGMQGILSGAGLSVVRWGLVDGIPLYQNLGLADSINKTVRLIKAASAARSQRPLFLSVYMLAWTIGPSHLKQIVQQLGDGYEIVLPKTLLAMLGKTLS